MKLELRFQQRRPLPPTEVPGSWNGGTDGYHNGRQVPYLPDGWTAARDRSVSGTGDALSCEIVSPILRGADGINAVYEAGNFYPDFIMWLLVDGKQYITFIDPKGISNLGINDPKILFYQTIKDLENRLGDPNVVLNSFLVSNTPSHVMTYRWGGVTKDKMQEEHIVFQEEDKETYIGKILGRIEQTKTRK